MVVQTSKQVKLAVCLVGTFILLAGSLVEAGQGCPFDDGSCQEYCNQQGCNLGYCGHFAWIQCICRKCGDEWNWFDKVHYKPDSRVNQTELDSLKLNGSAPIILTQTGNNNEKPQQQPIEEVKSGAQQVKAETKKEIAATLTTLLIPDLSDTNKLDLNDIPDENSEKFLDYLAKNHEKLAQATNKRQNGNGNDEGAEQAQDEEQQQQPAEETIEIQISSSNNQSTASDVKQTTSNGGTMTTQTEQPASSGGEPSEQEEEAEEADEEGGGQTKISARNSGGQMTRLLRMAVHERLAEELQ